jgi:hypothetical protein
MGFGFWRFLAMASLIAFSPLVQTGEASEYRLGFQFGNAVSNLSYDPDIPTDWYSAGMFGFTFDILDEEMPVGLVFELNHTQKGSDFFELNADHVDRYRFIELPVLFRVTSNREKRFSFYFEAGPAIAFNLSATRTSRVGTSSSETKISTARPVEFSAQAGAGVELSVKPDFRVFLTGRYAHGLTYASRADSNFSRAKLRAFEILIGPRIEL